MSFSTTILPQSIHLQLAAIDVSDTTAGNKKAVMTSIAHNFWHQEQKILTTGIKD